MYHVSAQGVDERMINVHYYYQNKIKRTKKRSEEMECLSLGLFL